MDVKCGRGAFMKKRDDAHRLAQTIVTIGNALGVRTEAVLTPMDAPLGRAVGNSLEMIECLEVLKGKGPTDLSWLSVRLAARMLILGGVAQTEPEAEQKVRSALSSGQGLEKFREIIRLQGGDPAVVDDYGRLPAAPHRHVLATENRGYVSELHAELIGRAAMVLGAGRERAEDRVDHAVGIVVRAGVGAEVKAGDPILELHYRDSSRLAPALQLLRNAWTVDDSPPTVQSLLLESVRRT